MKRQLYLQRLCEIIAGVFLVILFSSFVSGCGDEAAMTTDDYCYAGGDCPDGVAPTPTPTPNPCWTAYCLPDEPT